MSVFRHHPKELVDQLVCPDPVERAELGVKEYNNKLRDMIKSLQLQRVLINRQPLTTASRNQLRNIGKDIAEISAKIKSGE